ncbi:hypothetical protein N9A16_01120 [Pontimonas sp.]|nr:hypothetical protein [Pontimonas sp.]
MSRFVFPQGFRVEKNLNSANVDELVGITFTETDIDRMLTRVAERMIKAGRISRNSKSKVDGQPSDSLTVSELAEKLSASSFLSGFHGAAGTEAVEGWLRSSVIIVKGRGKGRRGEGIDYLAPITSAAYRTGFPRLARHRGADKMIHDLMANFLEALGVEGPHQVLRKYCEVSIGKGVDFGALPHNEPKYDGASNLDLNQLLALRFIELFDTEGLDNKTDSEGFSGVAIPGALIPLARDLVALFQVMAGEAGKGRTWSVSDSFSALRSVIAVRLFQLPLRLSGALRSALVGGNSSDLWKQPTAEEGQETLRAQWDNPLELYCDFTDVANSMSESIAKQSVGRDLDVLRLFFRDRMLFRATVQAGSQTPNREIFLGDANRPKSRRSIFEEVLRAQEDPGYHAAANWYLNNIESQLKDEGGETLDPASLRIVKEARTVFGNPLVAFAQVIVSSRENEGVDGLIKWIKATGGLQSAGLPKGYGILRGQEGARSSWKYRPAEELILNLVDMCFIDPPNSATSPVARARIKLPLSVLLARLRERYGILIDKPPSFLDNPETRQAASGNLKAFTGFLRDVGCFQTLSDDFAGNEVLRPRRPR